MARRFWRGNVTLIIPSARRSEIHLAGFSPAPQKRALGSPQCWHAPSAKAKSTYPTARFYVAPPKRFTCQLHLS